MAGVGSAPRPPRDATLLSLYTRWRWERGGNSRRKKLRLWARDWLDAHAPVFVPLYGGKMVLDGSGLISLSVFLTGSFEEEDESRFRALLRPGMTVLDVGANLGLYTLLSAVAVGPGGTVHAFEPVPRLFDYLSAGVRRSRLKNVRLNRVAISDTIGTVPMYLSDAKNTGLHSLAPSKRRPAEIRVESTTLAAYIRENGVAGVDVMKIDIEGAELLAFRGAGDLLVGDSAPIIQAELCDEHCEPFGYQTPELKAHLLKFGYQGFRAVPAKGWLPVSPDSPHPNWENILFVKPQHRPRLPADWEVPFS